MFIFSLLDKERENVEIFRGPNIKPIPENEPPQEEIKGIVTIKVGEKVTTDHIMQAGPYLKYRSNIPKYSTHVFEPIDPGFTERSIKNKERGITNIIVSGESYGQGSSREHAALCPMYLGVKAAIDYALKYNRKSVTVVHKGNISFKGVFK